MNSDKIYTSGMLMSSDVESFNVSRFRCNCKSNPILVIVELRSHLTKIPLKCNCDVLSRNDYPQISHFSLSMNAEDKKIILTTTAQKILKEKLTPVIKEAIEFITKE